MPAATTLLILKKDGKKRADGLVLLYSMGKSPPTTWKKFYLPRSLLGGISKGKDQHWQLHYTILQHFQAVKAFQHLEHQETSKHWGLYSNDVSGHKPADIPAPPNPGGVEVLPTRSSAGRAQSARRARSSCSRQLPVGSIVSTFTQVPGLEETGRSKKTKEQRCLNSSANILSHLDKRHARKTSIIGVQLLLQNSHDCSMHTHIQHRSVQPVSRARRGCMHCCLKPPPNSLCWNINRGKQSCHKHISSPTCSLKSMSTITVKDHGSGCPDPCRSCSHTAFPNHS